MSALEKYGKRELNSYIAEVYENRDAICTIISDDGIYRSGVLLNELAQKYQLRVTVAGAIRLFRFRVRRWKDILAKGYVELVNHSWNHIRMEEGTKISKSHRKLKHEISDAAVWFEKRFGKKPIAFVCPENQMCELGYEVIAESNIYAVRRGTRGYNDLFPNEGILPGEWNNLRTYGIMDEGVGDEERKAWVEEAIENKSWLIEMWHNVAYRPDGKYQTILYDEAEKHMRYLSEMQQKEKVWVANFTDVTKYIRERQASRVEAYELENNIFILIKMDTRKLKEDIFNHPLTVCVEIPEEWKDRKFTNFAERSINKVFYKGKYFILVNLKPNEDIVISIS